MILVRAVNDLELDRIKDIIIAEIRGEDQNLITIRKLNRKMEKIFRVEVYLVIDFTDSNLQTTN